MKSNNRLRIKVCRISGSLPTMRKWEGWRTQECGQIRKNTLSLLAKEKSVWTIANPNLMEILEELFKKVRQSRRDKTKFLSTKI